MVELNFDHSRPPALVDLNAVVELRGWHRESGEVVLGSGLTYTEAMESELAGLLPALAMASRTVGSPQIRNRGTIGGNLGTASPAGDALPPLLVEEARRRDRQRSRGIARFRSRSSSSASSEARSRPTSSSPSVRLTPSAAPQTFMKVGTRNAMVIAVCSLALAVDKRARRDPGRLRLGGARADARARPLAEADTLPSGSSRRRGRSTTSAARRPTAVTRSACSRAGRSAGASP